MVELFENEIMDTGRKSSKGNQLKWCRDGVWYKADYDSDVYECIGQPKPKTFCDDFDLQLDIAEKMYGNCLSFCFTKKDVDELLDAVPEGMYGSDVIERVRTVLYYQMRKYGYLFK